MAKKKQTNERFLGALSNLKNGEITYGKEETNQ